MIKNGIFYTPLTGASRVEIEAGMAGKDEHFYQRMLHELTAQAQLADSLGYDKLAISEHHFQVEGFEVPNNPVIFNAYLAGKTKNIKLGQLGILAAARHPVMVAEDIVLLDHLTQGRCFVGLARGAHTRTVDVLADKYDMKSSHPGVTDQASRQANYERFVENFEVMKKAWTEDTFRHDGRYWKIPPEGVVFKHPGTAKYGRGQNEHGVIEEVGIVPRPWTKPHPPVYVPFTASPSTVDWCARNQIRLVAFTFIHEQLDAILIRYRDAAIEAGHTVDYGDGIAHFKSVIIADTEEEARAHAESVAWAWTEWLGSYGFNEAFRLPGETGPVPNNFETTQRGHGFIVYGTPDQVLRRLEPFVAQYNVGELFNWIFNGIIPHEAIMKSLQLYAEKVAPKLG